MPGVLAPSGRPARTLPPWRAPACSIPLSLVCSVIVAAAAPPAVPAAHPAPDLAAALRRIQNTCFASYPPDLVEKMSGREGPVPDEVRSDPGRQIEYLKTEEVVAKGLFYPSRLEDLLPAFLATVRPGARFLDLGSGDGRVVFLAALLGARAAGVEYDRDLHRIALRARGQLADLLDPGPAELRRGDFFKEDLGSYDVLFYFTSGAGAEDRLLKKLRGEMRRDAILLYAYPYAPVEGFDRIGDYGVVRALKRRVVE